MEAVVGREWDVLGLGIAAVDDLLYLDRHPGPDTKVPVRGRQRQGGGLTATALVAAARLGVRAAYGGVMGRDELSEFTISELECDGVDCSPVLFDAEAGPCYSIILVDRSTGERTILYDWDRVTPRPAEQVTRDLIGRCRVLFVDYTAGAGGLRAVRLAHELGIQSVGDVERLNAPCAREILDEVDHLIVGIELARRVTGEGQPERMVRALGEHGRACSVVTAGERGCWYGADWGLVRHVPAQRVPVVDTTGCGDVFHGAYAACIAQGQGIDAAIQVATVAAGLKATQPGGRAGIPDRAAIDRYIKAHGGS